MQKKHLNLLIQMTKVDILSRYKGAYIGVVWSLLMPVFMLFVYTFVFNVILKAKWGASSSETSADFALLLFTGIVIHGFFAEIISRAPNVIIQNSNYVTKVIFPLPLLPLVNLLSGLFHSFISLFILLIALYAYYGHLPITAIFLPLIWLPMIVLLAGVSWLFAAIGVYVRDLAQVVGPLSMLLLFLSPVFYPISQVPEKWQALMLFNPLTLIIEQSRNVLIVGKMPDWSLLAIYMLIASVFCYGSYRVFQKLKGGFSDVL
jgi:lipopolysaccharide transport system permease protein